MRKFRGVVTKVTFFVVFFSWGILGQAEGFNNNSPLSDAQFARRLCMVVTGTPAAHPNTSEMKACLTGLNSRHAQSTFKNAFDVTVYVCEQEILGSNWRIKYASRVTCYRNAIGMMRNDDFAKFAQAKCGQIGSPDALGDCYRDIFNKEISGRAVQ